MNTKHLSRLPSAPESSGRIGQSKIKPLCALLGAALGLVAAPAYALDLKPGVGLGEFEDGEHRFDGDYLNEDLFIYGNFTGKTNDFTIHTSTGKLNLAPADGKKDRVLFISGNQSTYREDLTIPKLTVEGGVVIDRFESNSFQSNWTDDKGTALSTFAVVQAGADVGTSKKTSGSLHIQGDLSISNISSTDGAGNISNFKGDAVYVGQASRLDLSKGDGTVGALTISNARLTGSAINLGGTGYDSSAPGASATVGDVMIRDTNAQHALYMFGGTLDAGNLTVSGGRYDAHLIQLTGHQQNNNVNDRTTARIDDVTITDVTLQNGSALYVGTSSGGTSETGTVDAHIGNISLNNVTATLQDAYALIHFNQNSNTDIQIGDITVTDTTIAKHVGSLGTSALRFTANKSVTINGNGRIQFEKVSLIRGEDTSSTTYWTDYMSLVRLDHAVTNLNHLEIDSLTNDRTVKGTGGKEVPYLSALQLAFSDTQEIGTIDISTVETHEDGEVYGIYQSDAKNTLKSANVSVTGISGEKSAYGLNMLGKLMVSDQLTVSGIQGSLTEGEAFGVHAEKDLVLGNNSLIETVSGHDAIGLEANSSFTSSGDVQVRTITGTNKAVGVHLMKGGTTTGDVSIANISGASGLGLQSDASFDSKGNLFVDEIKGTDEATGADFQGKSSLGSKISISSVTATGDASEAYGMHVTEKPGTWIPALTQPSPVSGETILIENVAAGKTAYGLFAEDGKTSISTGWLNVTDVRATDLAVGLAAHEAQIRNLTITGIEADRSVALLALPHAEDTNGLTINGEESGTVMINGDVLVDDRNDVGTKLELNLTNNASHLVGAAGFTSSDMPAIEDRMTESADFSVLLSDSARWEVTDDSFVTELMLRANGTLDLTRGTADANGWVKVESKSFDADAGMLRLGINLGTESKDRTDLDRLSVHGAAVGNAAADIRIDGRDMADAASKFHSANWLVSQGAGSDLTILNKEGTNEFTGNGMVTTWALGFVADGDEAKLDTPEGLREIASATTGTESGKWYLVRTDESLPDPQPDPDPDPDPDPKPEDPGEMQTLTNLGISATQAMSFAAELEDLRTRLGEIRYGAQEGAWVKAGYAKERAEGFRGRGFEQKTTDLHIGLDRLVSEDESSAWLVGGALRYAESDQEGFAAAAGGDGTLEQYSAKLYAAYMHESGSYADFVLQAGRYDQEVKGLANDKTAAFRADYTGYGFGAGVELGHMFAFNETVDDRRWFDHAFFEPQLQLTYFRAQGEDYRTTTGMKVSQGDADFLTGRAGFVLGKKFGFGSAESLDRRFFQVGLKGGVKYEFLGDQTVRFTGVEGVTKKRDAEAFDGARWYYGITADWQMSEDFRAYANLEREEGDRYTKDFDVSVGVKYLF